VYTFLDPAKQHARLAGYICGIAIAQCIVFALVRGIIVLRRSLLHGMRGVFEVTSTLATSLMSETRVWFAGRC
jgi:hypothetical protein